ncbi:ADP-ribosyl-[dinitrogen reductase] glycohydrolase-like [Oculina patagonica]
METDPAQSSVVESADVSGKGEGNADSNEQTTQDQPVSNEAESAITDTNLGSTKESGHEGEHDTVSTGSQTIKQALDEEAPTTSSEEKQPSPGSKDKETGPPPSFNTESSLEKKDLLDHIKGVIYGNCIGDAIGLLTEFMSKAEAAYIYGGESSKGKREKLMEKFTKKEKKMPHLEYDMKYDDFHRSRWETGDWTDDSDQMILILQSLLENDGKMVPVDFAKKMRNWSRKGYPELGDLGGMGIGRTTSFVLHHPDFLTDPHKAAEYVWENSGRQAAPNGGVMRTSILGVHDFGNIEKVIENTKAACKVTHADPRCIASCVAVTTAVALMLQGRHFVKESNSYDTEAIMGDAYDYACATLETVEQEKELKKHMFAKSLDDLKLDEAGKIGYTYKCLGAGFWSLRQDDFRAALEAVTFEAGDADTNGAVAGALLGCKLGASKLPDSWRDKLKHKDWLHGHISNFLSLLGLDD